MRDTVYGAAKANMERAIQKVVRVRQNDPDNEGRSLKWSEVTPRQVEALAKSEQGRRVGEVFDLSLLLKNHLSGTSIEVKNIQDQVWHNVMDQPELYNPVINRYLTRMTSRVNSTVLDNLFTKIMSLSTDPIWVRDDVKSMIPFIVPEETVTLELEPSWEYWHKFTGKEILDWDFDIYSALERIDPTLTDKIETFTTISLRILKKGKDARSERDSYTLKRVKNIDMSDWQTFYPPIDSSMFVGTIVPYVNVRPLITDSVQLNGKNFKYLGQNTETSIHTTMRSISKAMIVDGRHDEMLLHIAASNLDKGSSEFGTVFKVNFGTEYVPFDRISQLYPMLFFDDKNITDEYFGNFEAKSEHIQNNIFQQACITDLKRKWGTEVDIHVYRFTAEDGTVDFMTHYRKSNRAVPLLLGAAPAQ